MQRTLQSLDDAAPEDRGAYVESPAGGYELHLWTPPSAQE